MSEETRTRGVSHLGGSTIGHRLGRDHDPQLPTLVLVNSFTTSVEQFRPQFDDEGLASAVNLVAIEPFGHGETRATHQQFTYWDSAIANLALLEDLGIAEAFVLGTSQGGWIATRMAMLAPTVVKGIIPLGTSMDFESPDSRDRGCWDGVAFCTPAIDALAAPVGDDWIIPAELVDAVLQEGLGPDVPADERDFWHAQYRDNYTGDDGRHRLRVSTINLRDRDGLHGRLDMVTCPVLWMHGTSDPVYSVVNAQDGIDRFTGAVHTELRVVDGGQHFLSASNPADVNAASVEFINRWA